MSEMWNSSGDDGADDWASDLFPPHWWSSQYGSNDKAVSKAKSTPELILTIDTIVNLLRVISVCPRVTLLQHWSQGSTQLLWRKGPDSSCGVSPFTNN
jgi:hypothetical protein